MLVHMGKRSEWGNHPIVRGGHRWRTVVRAAALEETGMRRRTVYQRCLPGGPWRRLLPGIIQLDPLDPGVDEQLTAALLRAGPRSMVTGLWAARRHGLSQVPTPRHVHVLVPSDCHVTSSGFVVIERTTRLPRAQAFNDLRFAPPTRAVLDGARRMRDVDAIAGMLVESIQRGRCTPSGLVRELSEGSQRGSALPRRVLAELLGGARSVAELDGSRLWKRAGLPPCERNVRIVDADGTYIAEPDAWVDDVGFAWEIDSREFHYGLAGYAATLRRNARYAAAGIVVVQTLPARIRREPESVVAELRAGFAAASRRPRPAVRVAA